MGSLLNGAIVGAGVLTVTGATSRFVYTLTENSDDARARRKAGAFAGVAAGFAFATMQAASLALLIGVRIFAHVPGRTLARTLTVMRHITVYGGLFVGGAVGTGVILQKLHDDKEATKKSLKAGGGFAVAAVSSGLAYGIIKQGAKPTLTLAGRVFAKWGLAPLLGGLLVYGINSVS